MTATPAPVAPRVSIHAWGVVPLGAFLTFDHHNLDGSPVFSVAPILPPPIRGQCPFAITVETSNGKALGGFGLTPVTVIHGGWWPL